MSVLQTVPWYGISEIVHVRSLRDSGELSDNDGEDDACFKMNYLYFTYESHNCLDVFGASIAFKRSSCRKYKDGVYFPKEIPFCKVLRIWSFRVVLQRDGKEF